MDTPEEELRAIVERFKGFTNRVKEAKPLIEALQVATLARDLPAIDSTTVNVLTFMIDAVELLNGLPGTEDLAQGVAVHKRLRKAILDKDETEKAIATAEGLGIAFNSMIKTLGTLTTLCDSLMEPME